MKQRFLRRYLNLTTILVVVAAICVIYFYTRDGLVTQAVLSSMIRQSTPLILGALCGLMCERSGIINIGIEGQMLLSAFAGFMVSAYSSSAFLGVLASILTGALTGLLLAFMSINLKLDQIIGGTVINILATGLTGYFYTQGLVTQGKLQSISLGPLAQIPLLGPVLFDNPPITFSAIILVFVIHYVLFFTKWGLRIRSVGEHPRAADTLGINVNKTRYISTIIGGALAGLAGGFLTLEAVGSFERSMTNGRGFVALACLIFGKWTPIGAWGASLLFGLATAIQTQLQFSGNVLIPHQFIGMLPYLLTIIVLAGFVGKARPPKSEGSVYEKEG